MVSYISGFSILFMPLLRFADCCTRAYDAALNLAAWAGNFTTESLKTYYEDSCAGRWFDQSHSHAPEFDCEEESDDEAAKARDMLLARLFYVLAFYKMDSTGMYWVSILIYYQWSMHGHVEWEWHGTATEIYGNHVQKSFEQVKWIGLIWLQYMMLYVIKIPWQKHANTFKFTQHHNCHINLGLQYIKIHKVSKS